MGGLENLLKPRGAFSRSGLELAATSGGLVRRPLASFLGLCRRSLSAAAFPGAFPVALVRTRLLGLGFADCP